jgi:hypothetical protein
MSDLQCPATVLLVPRESCASDDVARFFVGRRVAGFFVDAALAANPHELAAINRLAGSSDCQIEVTDAAFVDCASLEQALEDFADLYRGETIAVVASGDLIQSLLRCARTPTEPITIAIDDSGWAATPCHES